MVAGFAGFNFCGEKPRLALRGGRKQTCCGPHLVEGWQGTISPGAISHIPHITHTTHHTPGGRMARYNVTHLVQYHLVQSPGAISPGGRMAGSDTTHTTYHIAGGSMARSVILVVTSLIYHLWQVTKPSTDTYYSTAVLIQLCSSSVTVQS